MTATPVAGAAGTAVVDTHLLDVPELAAAYLVEGKRTALVDTGAAPALEHLLAALDDRGLAPADLDEILLTHVHLDHAGAAGAVAERCPNATVRVHEAGRPYLTDPDRLDRLVAGAREAMDEVADGYGEPTVLPPARCEPVTDGDTVDLGDRELSVVAAPGHAPHQVCFHDDRTGVLFAGDAAGMSLGGELYPTTPAPDFDLDASLDTLARLREREPAALALGHFGVRRDADDLLAVYEELLPAWVEAVESAAAETDGDREEITAALADEWRQPTLARDVAGVLAARE